MRPRRHAAVASAAPGTGRVAGFSSVYEQHAPGVLGYFVRRTFDVEASKDLTAETFAQAFAGWRRFRGTTEEEAAAWVYGIARHLLSRYVRKGIVERRMTRRLGLEVPDTGEEDHDRIVRLAGLQELRLTVADQYDQLGSELREAVRLRVIEELPYAEVARRLAVTEVTARARVSRGLRRMASMLDDVPTLREMTA